MIIFGDGRISGTVGGGALEGDVIRSAMNLFSSRKGAIRFYDLDETTATCDLDLVCGGKMHLFLEYVAADRDSIGVYRTLVDSLESSRPSFLAALVRGDDDHLDVERSVLTRDGQPVDPALSRIPDSNELVESLRTVSGAKLVSLGSDRVVIEPLIPPCTLYILGAGHVSKELAVLAGRLSFRTIIIDDRPDFANLERFPAADTIRVCPGFEDVFKGFSLDADSFVVIVTRGHRFDRKVLAQALTSMAGYIGMIGSSRKKDTIYRALADEGVDPADLEKVHCPVGVDIEAETPDEIAVSIAAELIEHRARNRSHG
jgi:xanthine dehydrogenase accessory factor